MPFLSNLLNIFGLSGPLGGGRARGDLLFNFNECLLYETVDGRVGGPDSQVVPGWRLGYGFRREALRIFGRCLQTPDLGGGPPSGWVGGGDSQLSLWDLNEKRGMSGPMLRCCGR